MSTILRSISDASRRTSTSTMSSAASPSADLTPWRDLHLVVILLVALVLRVYVAMVSTYTWDEDRDWIPVAKLISLQPSNPDLPIRGGQHPALPAYFIRLGSLVLGENNLGFRFASLLAGLLTVYLLYVIGREWAGVWAGRLSAGLLALNEYHIGISALAVEKAFYLAFATLAIYVFIRFLRTQAARYLYLAATATGLGFLCKELSILLIPVFFIGLLLSSGRFWLRRKEPYLALALFFVVISPDLYWNLVHPVTEGIDANYVDHFSRIGGIGISKYPFLFYMRQPLLAVGTALGKTWDWDRPYPSMNFVFGAILLGGVLLATLRDARKDATTRVLGTLFCVVFGFFILIRPGTPDRSNLTAVSPFWVDLSLIPAVLLSASYLSRLSVRWMLPAAGVTTAATAYSVAWIWVSHLGLAPVSIGCSPEFLTPPDARMVAVRPEFNLCTTCGSVARTELLNVQIIRWNPELPRQSAVGSPYVEGFRPGTDGGQLRLKATTDFGDKGSGFYHLTYRMTSQFGTDYVLSCNVGATATPYQTYRPKFWVR